MATFQRRERPRTMYATIHRSPTDTPFLYLKPVIFSLTEGTSIPAPKEADIMNTPPISPTRSISKYSCFPSPSLYAPQTIFGGVVQSGGGPLSSHPVSPCTSPSSGTSPTSFSIGSSSPSVDEDEYEDSVFSDARRNTWRSDRATIGNRASTMYNWMPAASIMEEERQPQRPRFVERFLRIRAGSRGRGGKLKHESGSTPLIGPQAYSFEGDGRLKEPVARETRMKRAASYSANLGLNLQDTDTGNGGSDVSKDDYKRKTYASATFPRMARKKSFDILSTMKRVSGNWWKDEDDSAESAVEVWDRRAAAEETEGALHGEDEDSKWKEEAEDDSEVRTIMLVEPAPALPELETIGVELDGGKLGGTELFEEIGK